MNSDTSLTVHESCRQGTPQHLEGVLIDGRTSRVILRNGTIVRIEPMEGTANWLALPLPVDPHVHLDKTHIIGRCKSGAAGLLAAIAAQHADMLHWDAADIRRRAGRALEEAWQNGLRALRTHIDWTTPDVPLAWGVLGELAVEWSGRIAIQRAALCPLDLLADPEIGPGIAASVAREAGAVLGAFVYRNERIEEKLARVFALAERHGLYLDFHVDEGLDQEARGFDSIVALTARHRMAGQVLCGHACALSVRPADEVARVLDDAAGAGIGLTILPSTNSWLQDATPGRTPRLRGLAPLQEARQAGVDVLFGIDNVADPFFPFGAYDALDIHRQAVLAAHLDPADWVDAITTVPAGWLGLDPAPLAAGARADFMLIHAAGWQEALRRPRAQRRIFRSGQEFSNVHVTEDLT